MDKLINKLNNSILTIGKFVAANEHIIVWSVYNTPAINIELNCIYSSTPHIILPDNPILPQFIEPITTIIKKELNYVSQ